MSVQNPFGQDPVLGGPWEEGYLAGFSEPETDHFRPFEPDILDAYRRGEQVGRDDRRRLPPDSGGVSEEGESGVFEFLKLAAEEIGLHTLGHGFFHSVFGKVGGLLSLMPLVLQIPGDVILHPMEDDWTGSVDMAEDSFVAVCPRTDHGPMEGVTPEGYWTGPGRQFFSDALADKLQHQHVESAVCRCSVPSGECGLVWPGGG
jgi:hypothetical protein